MADLFQTTVPNINLHLKNIFAEGELDTQATVKDFLIVQDEGGRQVKRTRKLYNLDAIISVGYTGQVPCGHSVRNNLETLDSVEEVRMIKEAVRNSLVPIYDVNIGRNRVVRRSC